MQLNTKFLVSAIWCSGLVSAQEKCGGCSSVGRVPDCDSGCRGFESHQPPHRIQMKSGTCAKAGCLFSFPDGGRIRHWWHASGAALNLDHVLAVVHPPGGGGVAWVSRFSCRPTKTVTFCPGEPCHKSRRRRHGAGRRRRRTRRDHAGKPAKSLLHVSRTHRRPPGWP